MKMILLRIVAGWIAALLCLGIVLYFFLFTNPFQIHEPNLLKWVPALGVLLGFSLSGCINKSTNYKFLPALLLPLVILKPFGFFYFPLIIGLTVIALCVLVVTREAIGIQLKRGAGVMLMASFVFLLFSQPLILEKPDFAYNDDGEMINAMTIWNFYPKKNVELPDHSLLDQDGEVFNLKELKGETCFISFWATWCAPCIENKPALEILKNELSSTDIQFVYISFDDNKDAWTGYLSDHKADGRQLRSEDHFATGRQFDFAGIPMYLIVSQDGTYRKIRSYESAQDALRKIAGQ